MTPRRIYLASSWRNEDQPRILELLRTAGHEVYDFRNPFDGGPTSDVRRGFSWSEIDENWRSWTPAQYRDAMAHPAAVRGFAADFNAMQWADTCVVLLPSGPSAALEAGWCAGSGRDVIVHVAGLREPDLMYKIGRRFTLTDAELLAAVHERHPATDLVARIRAWEDDPNLRTVAAVELLHEAADTLAAIDAALPPLDADETKPLGQRVADEMADYAMVIDHASRVFCDITSGRISKPNTLPEVVIAVADDLERARQEEAIAEATNDLQEEVDANLAAVHFLAHYLARAVNRDVLRNAINDRCTCGGRPPDENACCPACRVGYDLGLTP